MNTPHMSSITKVPNTLQTPTTVLRLQRMVAMPIGAVLIGVGLLATTAGPSAANPCDSNGPFALANGCGPSATTTDEGDEPIYRRPARVPANVC